MPGEIREDHLGHVFGKGGVAIDETAGGGPDQRQMTLHQPAERDLVRFGLITMEQFLTKPVHVAGEILLGHGGGGFDADWKRKIPAPLLERMGKAAFFGTDKPEENPWQDPARVAFRRDFYKAALGFLTTQPGRWRVENAYLWSYGSWDVHGIHGTPFGDPQIAHDIRKHNAAMVKSR